MYVTCNRVSRVICCRSIPLGSAVWHTDMHYGSGMLVQLVGGMNASPGADAEWGAKTTAAAQMHDLRWR